MIPIIGIAAIASRLVIESGIRLVAHRLTQRKKTHKTLYPSLDKSVGPSKKIRMKNVAKKNVRKISRRIRSRITNGIGRRSTTISEVFSVAFICSIQCK